MSPLDLAAADCPLTYVEHALSHTKNSASIFIVELPLSIPAGRAASAVAAQKLETGLDKPRSATMELSKRVQFLKVEAEIDRVPFSESSLADFRSFMRDIGLGARPSLFLNDNGNLRALWKNDRREQIGLQFLGDGNIQFVIFKQPQRPVISLGLM